MVRLLQYEAFGFTAMETFQFLNGTIITFLLKLFAVANFLFQFLNGTIITRRGQEHGRLLAVSIPQWYDYYLKQGYLIAGQATVSIPQWYDYYCNEQSRLRPLL